jgi:hypothetical protein
MVEFNKSGGDSGGSAGEFQQRYAPDTGSLEKLLLGPGLITSPLLLAPRELDKMCLAFVQARDAGLSTLHLPLPIVDRNFISSLEREILGGSQKAVGQLVSIFSSFISENPVLANPEAEPLLLNIKATYTRLLEWKLPIIRELILSPSIGPMELVNLELMIGVKGSSLDGERAPSLPGGNLLHTHIDPSIHDITTTLAVGHTETGTKCYPGVDASPFNIVPIRSLGKNADNLSEAIEAQVRFEKAKSADLYQVPNGVAAMLGSGLIHRGPFAPADTGYFVDKMTGKRYDFKNVVDASDLNDLKRLLAGCKDSSPRSNIDKLSYAYTDRVFMGAQFNFRKLEDYFLLERLPSLS